MKLDNETLERIACWLEQRAGNAVYQQAWKAAAKHIREMQKLTDANAKLAEGAGQISNEHR